MTASTDIGPPKHGYVLTISNSARTLVPVCTIVSRLKQLVQLHKSTRADHGRDVLSKKMNLTKRSEKDVKVNPPHEKFFHRRLRFDVFDFITNTGTQHL